jgi:hypothetical protein
MRLPTLALALLVFSSAAFADLTDIRSEKNLEKRADRAIDHAESLAHDLKKTYENESWDATKNVLAEIAQSMELAFASLTETGKSARRSPKHFKKAELKSRDILRRLDAVHTAVAVDDREAVDKVRARVQKVHDDLLQAIMSK